MQDETQAQQGHHYFVSNCYCWVVADTLEGALRKMARELGTETIKRARERAGGLLCHTCRVELPITAHYDISFYVPVNVPTSERQYYRLQNGNGAAFKVDENGNA